MAGAGIQAAEGVLELDAGHGESAAPQQPQGSRTYFLFRVDFLFRVTYQPLRQITIN